MENTDVDLEAVDSGGFNAADIAALNGYLSWEERGKNSDVADTQMCSSAVFFSFSLKP